jgi:hypothetical protein
MVNWLVSEDLMASIAVRIPTSAMIPNAIIQMVRIDLTLFDLIALIEILRFSQNSPNLLNLVKADGINNHSLPN